MRKTAIFITLFLIIFTLSSCGDNVFERGVAGKSAHITVKTPSKTVIDEEISFDDAKVIDALTFVAKKSIIEIKVSGSSGMEYVESIDGLAQFDMGAKSGWIYRVNGKMPNVGAGAYTISDGDKIEWQYVTEYVNE